MAINPFIETPRYLSFSNLIDQVCVITGAPVNISKFVTYGNLAIKEALIANINFRDLREDSITVTESPMPWDLPANFRTLKTVYYSERDAYPAFAPPGRISRANALQYYGSGDSIMFGGLEVGETIKLAYYVWHRPLVYYPRPDVLSTVVEYNYVPSDSEARPAYYDTVTGTWYYLQEGGETYETSLDSEDDMTEARAASADWVVLSHPEFVMAAILSKFYTSKGNQVMSVPYYSQYQKALAALSTTEARETMDQ